MRTPQTYQKKALRVRAMQWDGTLDGIRAICGWANPEGPPEDGPWIDYVETHVGGKAVLHPYLNSDQGVIRIDPGTWVIRGLLGELYKCDADVFTATYDAVEALEGQP